jgi:hypothetical protein
MSALDETNRSAPLPRPACEARPDREAIRLRGPRRESEPAESAFHPDLPPAGGKKGRAVCTAATEPADAIQCICIDPAHVERVWPLVSHLISAAMRKGRISVFADVERAVLGGTQLLWVAADRQAIWAAAVTALGRHNGEKFCTIVACGGRERARWLPLKAELEAFAKAEGCAAIRIHGRRGWAREFPDYRLTRILLEKDLT